MKKFLLEARWWAPYAAILLVAVMFAALHNQLFAQVFILLGTLYLWWVCYHRFKQDMKKIQLQYRERYSEPEQMQSGD